jgi:stalled ribosome rescue protein Dom34
MLNWIALEGPAAIAEFVKEKDPSVQFADEYVGICHICNEVLTRPDVRRVIAEHLPEITERVSTHRAFFEGIRGDEELVASYVRP